MAPSPQLCRTAVVVLLLSLGVANGQWYDEPINSNLVGYYERMDGNGKIIDKWLRLFLYKVKGGGYRWHNSAGTKWAVTLKTPKDVRLMDAADPYNTAKVEIHYVGDDPTKAITEVTGPHGSAYARVSDLPTCEAYTCTDAMLTKAADNFEPCDQPTNHNTIKDAYVAYAMKACADSDCCKAYCTIFTCDSGAGFIDKANKATIECGAAAADCTAAKCCDSGVLCAMHPCGAGLDDKAGKATIGCGATAADCTDEKCCDANCAHMGYSCPAYYQNKVMPATIACGAVVGDCTEEKCCAALCGLKACGAGLDDKAAKATLVCGAGKAAECTDVNCCDVNCAHADYSCPAKFQAKPNPDSIPCGAVSSACTEATCCDALVQCDTYTCSAKFRLKAAAAALSCGLMASGCSDAKCCDALCGHHTCGAGLDDKAAKATVGCGATAADCTDEKCCDVNCAHMGYLCPAKYQIKAMSEAIACGVVVGDCTEVKCCDALCGHHTCSARFQDKLSKATERCGPMPADCTDEKCCAALCEHHTCAAGFADKTAKATTVCGASPADCSDEKCCDATCGHSSYLCPSKFQPKERLDQIVCGTAVSDCTEAKCCDALVYCDSFSCSNMFQIKAKAEALTCGLLASDCDDTKCCDALVYCDGYSCPAREQLKAGAASLECGISATTCTRVMCCDAIVYCAAHTCPGGHQQKALALTLECGISSAGCTNAKCCDAYCDSYTCPARYQWKSGAGQLLCGPVASDCGQAKCCDALVYCDVFNCSARFQAKDGSSNEVCGTVKGDCTDAVCCDAIVYCDQHTCSSRMQLKEKRRLIACGLTTAACTDAACCDALVYCDSRACEGATVLSSVAKDKVCGLTTPECSTGLCCTADTPTSGLSLAKKEKLKGPTTVASAAAVGTANGGRLVILKGFGCAESSDDDLEDLSWEVHPMGFAMGSSPSRFVLAAMLMNPVVVVVTGCVPLFLVMLFRYKGDDWDTAMGKARWPGVLYLPHVFLLQGTSLVSALVCFNPGRHATATIVVAWAMLLVSCASPAAVYWVVVRRVGSLAHCVDDPDVHGDPDTGAPGKHAKNSLYKIAFGKSMWVSSQGHFAEKYGIVFEGYREGCMWHILAESLVILVLSIVASIKTTDTLACNARNFIITAVLVLFFLACLVVRPFISAADNGFAIITSATVAASALFITIAITAGVAKDGGLYEAAFFSILLAAICVIAKGIWDIVQYAWDAWIERRASARESSRTKQLNESEGTSLRERELSVCGSSNGSYYQPPMTQTASVNLPNGWTPSRPMDGSPLARSSAAFSTFGASAASSRHVHPSQHRHATSSPELRTSHSTNDARGTPVSPTKSSNLLFI